MKIQFDENQPFQLAALAAVTDLFDGQPQGMSEFSITSYSGGMPLLEGQERTELGLGNRLLLAEEKLTANTRAVQLRNDIEAPDPDAPLEAWPLFDTPANVERKCPHFSVEMETGTGKTYVYLRTIYELSKRYGFQKFIIVVPSVAIREGVLKSIEIMKEHFAKLFNAMSVEHFVYEAKNVERLRPFATANITQICIINIQAFNKNSAVMYKETEKLSGHQPIEFVQTARPIVIIDEPQSVEGGEEGAGMEAIKALNPLCTLRYSATHRNPYNLVYRLDPVTAFKEKLVKQIIVASAVADGTANDAFVRVEKVDYKPTLKAKLSIHVQGPDGPKPKAVTAKQGADLFTLSNERACYRDGFEIAEIYAEPDSEFVRFANGKTLRLGEEMGGMRDDVWRVQIKHTIKKHLDKELQVRERGIKVLSLFFIDRVANYRDYDDSGPVPGKFAAAFEAELKELAKEERYQSLPWLKEPVERLHNGYFAQDRSGVFRDSREGRSSQADEDTYNLIMKDKERLLSVDEPLRFIFSHSALREGWDNPNVFQICTLNETKSVVKKRQEIGRGLRLPVDQNGKRVFDPSINKLYVMANESYEDFARALQTEYENDCGVSFGKVPITALAKLAVVVDGEEKPIGRAAAETIKAALVEQKMLDAEGRILSAFNPGRLDFKMSLPAEHGQLAPAVIDLLSSYQIERHVRRERDDGPNRLKQPVHQLGPEFEGLWASIKAKTTYSVEFETETLIARAVDSIKRNLEKVEKPVVKVVTAKVDVAKGGVTSVAIGTAEEKIERSSLPVPDLLAYLQNETELTRSTLATILKQSGRLDEFFNDPQRFMDGVAHILKYELHRLLIDEIKYEKVPSTERDFEWQMSLFKNEELINYLTAVKVEHSIYEYVSYDSETEQRFAQRLDARDDIKLFIKLPSWFLIDTPLGKYNPDWAILKKNGQTLYLVRETKSTRDFFKLRTSESDKVSCGQKHFNALGVPFDVVVTADEV